MKNKSIITILCLCMGLGMATTSCEDMLSSDSERHSYTVAGDTLYSYWGILKSLQNIGERYVILGECRGDLIDGGEFTTDSVNAILSFGLNGDTENIKDGANRYLKVSDYYHVINSCNAYLAMADTVMEKANGQKYMIREYAQVEAIRAWVYMQLVINYGNVPFYLEPMITTNDIINFDTKNPKNRVTSSTLLTQLESRLKRAYQIEEQWGYPQYYDYGYTTNVCHSSKAMFPVALVLADMYLMANEYVKAAEYYYEFLDGKYGGALSDSYFATAILRQGENTPSVTISEGMVISVSGSTTTISRRPAYPWNETGSTNSTNESITAIPSSTNALWGTVQRGVNDLYGFQATIRQSTSSDSITRATISIARNWERQLGPSAGYDTLRLAQKFETYVTSNSANLDDEILTQLVVLDSVGDARGVAGQYGEGYISRYNSGDYYVDETKTQRYIMKQNPRGVYTTVFPMVYRKSMVWLRFAEALNRAGYPGYAFAILKNGLTRNSTWLPTNEAEFAVKTMRVHYVHTGTKFDEDGNPVLDENNQPVQTTIVLPEDWKTNDLCVIHSKDYDEEAYLADSTAFAQAILAMEPTHFDTIVDYTAGIYTETENYANFMPASSHIVCDYISRGECERSKGLVWLDFNKNQFNGASNIGVMYIRDYPVLQSTSTSTVYYPLTSTENEYYTRGIHQKGCGLLKPNEKKSVYNFVDQINLKLEAAGKLSKDSEGKAIKLTKAEIYDMIGTDGQNIDIQEAIEDLILDEAGLELAFEGNRFFDLMRVAKRRSNPGQFMANKIKARGIDAEAWADQLINEKNWYLPLPDNSNR